MPTTISQKVFLNQAMWSIYIYICYISLHDLYEFTFALVHWILLLRDIKSACKKAIDIPTGIKIFRLPDLLKFAGEVSKWQ